MKPAREPASDEREGFLLDIGAYSSACQHANEGMAQGKLGDIKEVDIQYLKIMPRP